MCHSLEDEARLWAEVEAKYTASDSALQSAIAAEAATAAAAAGAHTESLLRTAGAQTSLTSLFNNSVPTLMAKIERIAAAGQLAENARDQLDAALSSAVVQLDTRVRLCCSPDKSALCVVFCEIVLFSRASLSVTDGSVWLMTVRTLPCRWYSAHAHSRAGPVCSRSAVDNNA